MHACHLSLNGTQKRAFFKKIISPRHTERFISRFVDNRLWKDLAGSVSPSLSDESSPPGELWPKFFALLLPHAILQCRHYFLSLSSTRKRRPVQVSVKRWRSDRKQWGHCFTVLPCRSCKIIKCKTVNLKMVLLKFHVDYYFVDFMNFCGGLQLLFFERERDVFFEFVGWLQCAELLWVVGSIERRRITFIVEMSVWCVIGVCCCSHCQYEFFIFKWRSKFPGVQILAGIR